jgi:alkylation response protein AidB-like acyl-CoA dehydrogenase
VKPVERARRVAVAIAARAAEHDRQGSFPHDNIADLRAAGLLGLVVPRSLGGGGAGLREASEVVGIVGGACASTGLVLAMQYLHHGMLATRSHWPRDLHEAVASQAASDGALLNSLRAEAELGTPARGGLPSTVARWDGASWHLDGRKIYATGAPAMGWWLVWARTDGDGPKVGQFLVPADAPGLSIVPTWDHLGLRASGSHDVLLTDVVVPAGHAVDLRAPADWAAPDPVHVAWNVVLLSSLYLGVARAARDWLVSWLRTRTPTALGAPLATLPRVQEIVGEIESLLFSAGTLIDTIAATYDGDRAVPPPSQLGLAKHTANAHAARVLDLALSLTGNAGLTRANPLERHHRDVQCARVHTPQSDSILLAAGRRALLD